MELQYLEDAAADVKMHDLSLERGRQNIGIGSVKINILEGHQSELHMVVFKVSASFISRS